METKFTEQQSLTLISEMITQARNNFQKGRGNSMIFNGCLVALIALANIVLIYTLSNPYHSFWIWCLMIPGSFVSAYIRKKVDKASMIKTHIDTIIGYTWVGFGCAVCILLAIILGLGLGRKIYEACLLINPIILTMTGLAEFITAKACKFKPYFYGAIVMWTGAIGCTILFLISNNSVVGQFLILAICMIIGFVVPGYKLNKLAEKHV